MSTRIIGVQAPNVSRNAEGHREYQVTWLVEASSRYDGPSVVLATPGLPAPGSLWTDAFGTRSVWPDGGHGNDLDEWATCRLDSTAKMYKEDSEGTRFWAVTQVFSTQQATGRCNEAQIDNPLLQPPRISGGFSKYTEEKTLDRFDIPLTNSAFEQLRGPVVEFDMNRPTVRVEMNVANLDLSLFANLVDCVNDAPMWGMPERCIKLSGMSWEKKYYGSCFIYFTYQLEFDLNAESFDRFALDEGTKVLRGDWVEEDGELTWTLRDVDGETPDAWNPAHFEKYADPKGNAGKVVLNGEGVPAEVLVTVRKLGNDRYVNKLTGVNNTNHVVTDTAFWIKQVGGDSFWDATTDYVVGEVVALASNDNELYICVTASTNQSPDASASWLHLPGGIVDKGVWDATTAYTDGERVYGPDTFGDASEAGRIPIQVYRSANLFMTGVPVSLLT